MQTFGKDVNHLVEGMNMKNSCLIKCYFFLNKVNIHLNMFYTLIPQRITKQINGTNIITVYQSTLRERKMKLQYEIEKQTIFNNICNTLVFNLYTRMKESILVFWRLRDEVVTKKHTITRCGTFVIKTSTLVNISVRNKFLNKG